MGRAIIASEQGKGQYTVIVQVQQGYTNTVLARLNAKIVYVEGEITSLETELSDLQYDASNIRDINDAKIITLEAEIDTLEG